jgi:hypothetical protein
MDNGAVKRPTLSSAGATKGEQPVAESFASMSPFPKSAFNGERGLRGCVRASRSLAKSTFRLVATVMTVRPEDSRPSGNEAHTRTREARQRSPSWTRPAHGHSRYGRESEATRPDARIHGKMRANLRLSPPARLAENPATRVSPFVRRTVRGCRQQPQPSSSSASQLPAPA